MNTITLKTVKDILVNDTEWKGSWGGRCITDYSRSITVKKELSESEVEDVVQWLRSNKCPGWTPIRHCLVSSENGEFMYRFTTTYDSSD